MERVVVALGGDALLRRGADDTYEEMYMGSKVEAAINFLEAGGSRAVIADLEQGPQALAGEAGTELVP
jgi:carbamate kinase